MRGDLVFASYAARLAELAARWHLPVSGGYRETVMAGTLMAFSTSLSEHMSRAGPFVDKILRGRQPADLPVEQIDTLRLTVNLKTARALGLTSPPDIVAQVTEWV